jgi:hypothetical protein
MEHCQFQILLAVRLLPALPKLTSRTTGVMNKGFLDIHTYVNQYQHGRQGLQKVMLELVTYLCSCLPRNNSSNQRRMTPVQALVIQNILELPNNMLLKEERT